MDEGNGLDFLRARYYSPTLGRFQNQDPIGLAGGDANFYRYVKNNPVSLIDPSGLIPSQWDYPSYDPNYYANSNKWINDFGHHDFFHRVNPQTGAPSIASYREGYSDQGIMLSGNDPWMGQITFFSDGTYELSSDRFSIYETNNSYHVDGFLSHTFYDVIPIKLGIIDDERRFGIWNWDRYIYDLIQKIRELSDQNKLGEETTQIRNSLDPNDVVGPAGFGTDRWLVPNQVLPYTVRFENASSATAPAVFVTVTHQLDSDLDLSTFELGDFGFRNITIDVPNGLQAYSTRVDLRSTMGYFVDFAASLNATTGTVTWKLTTIDPLTGQLPTTIDGGFLPPNNAAHDGEGFVNYKIKAKPNLPTGAQIDALASIVFDTNAAIATPLWRNTVDVSGPTSSVTSLPTTTTTPNFTVAWSGTDSGSGITSYDIYVSDNGSPFTLWLDDTTNTSAIYKGQIGHTYAFYSVAQDGVGYIEVTPPQADAITTVGTLGIVDFTGDGKADILWRNQISGQNGIWQMDGTALVQGSFLGNDPGVPGSSGWDIVGVADFTGDGKSDILWRNAITGQNGIWQMDGTAFVQGLLLGNDPGVPGSSGWDIVGVADFTGDGKSDILWRQAATGQNGIWQMNGTTFVQGLLLGNAPVVPGSSGWDIVGTGDFTDDGKADIVWHNRITGESGYWQMNGTTFSGATGSFETVPAASGWYIAGVTDFNQDGKADLFWQNNLTGGTGIWTMNGTTRLNSIATSNVGANSGWYATL